MNSRLVYLLLSLLVLVCAMGLSQSSAQHKGQNKPGAQQQATQAAPPVQAASPTPTPPAGILNNIQTVINGFSDGDEAFAYERTYNFQFLSCDLDCKDCTLKWDVEWTGDTPPPPGGAREKERFSVEVKLGAINPKRVFVDGTQVQFGTNNGRSITVKQTYPVAKTDSTDAWQISVRSEEGAKEVARLLKLVLNQSCPKP